MKVKSLFLALLIFCYTSIPAFAIDNSRQYELSLSANGKQEIQVNTGDIITVTAQLSRTDSDKSSTMYGLQDEIRYDDQFIQIVDGMTVTTNDIKTTDIGLVDGERAFYINYLSFGGDTEWPDNVLMANFQIKVLGEKGATKLKNENVIISTHDGSDSYQYTIKDLLIVVTSECTVKFDSNGGTEIEPITVQIGDYIMKPENPQREGYSFIGWYSDISMNNEWDFDTDIVESNMTLYAKWENESAVIITPVIPEETPPITPDAIVLISCFIVLMVILLVLSRKTVTYIAYGKEYLKVKVKKNSKFIPPVNPSDENLTFEGWYKDINLTEKLDFEKDTVKQSIKLYAKFK